MQTRDRLHRLIDELPDAELPEVERLLAGHGGNDSLRRALAKFPNDPLLRALADAPEDDEPLTPEEAAAIEEARRSVAAGRVVSDDELWQRLDHAPRG